VPSERTALDAATRCFWSAVRRHVNDDLTDAMGINRSSLYASLEQETLFFAGYQPLCRGPVIVRKRSSNNRRAVIEVCWPARRGAGIRLTRAAACVCKAASPRLGVNPSASLIDCARVARP